MWECGIIIWRVSVRKCIKISASVELYYYVKAIVYHLMYICAKIRYFVSLAKLSSNNITVERYISKLRYQIY
jgi:hypothetical protein